VRSGHGRTWTDLGRQHRTDGLSCRSFTTGCELCEEKADARDVNSDSAVNRTVHDDRRKHETGRQLHRTTEEEGFEQQQQQVSDSSQAPFIS